ncbi:MAG: 50S ribosomal protein L22 [Planctomycetaceae bacterium]
MAYTATHKYARISARKVRALADLVRGKHADDALDILRFQPQRGARLLEKVIRSALGNAEHDQAAGIDDLIVSDARVDEGPTFKRIRPRARGMAFGIKRRTAHIRVSLDAPVLADEPSGSGNEATKGT